MKKIVVKVSKYDSIFYPICGRFTLNNKEYNLVFESLEELQRYFECRFYPIEIVFKGVE